MTGYEIANLTADSVLQKAKERGMYEYAYGFGYIQSRLGTVLDRLSYSNPELFKEIVDDFFPELKETAANG